MTFPPPPNVIDFAPFLVRIKDTHPHPDVVYTFIPGGPIATRLLKASADIGFSKIPFVSTQDLIPDEELVA